MSLDYWDKKYMETIHETIKAGNKANAEAFNRVAEALETLAKEVKGLREDMNPAPLDKPAKLTQPASKGATP